MGSIAVVGLGTMGGGIASRLVEVGESVHVWNRSRAPVAALAAAGAHPSSSPRIAAEAGDPVLLVVADMFALQSVLEGPDGVLAGLQAGGTVVVMSTVSPETVQSLAPRVAAARGHLLEAAMLGNGQHARGGELRLYVGGNPEIVERQASVLGRFAKQVTSVGPLGSGMSYKLVLNLLMGLEMQALAEVIVLGEGLGLDREQLLSTVTSSGFSAPVMSFKARRMIRRSYKAPDFRLELMAKDLRLATEEAERRGITMPLTRVAAKQHRIAVERGFGSLDCAAIADATGDLPAVPNTEVGPSRQSAPTGSPPTGSPS